MSVSANLPISIQLSQKLKALPPVESLGFGQYFSDHMFAVKYSQEKGWHSAQITPYAPIPMDPAASVLHYGQALFEGMKAFYQTKGQLVLFRPDFNAQRLAQGAARLCMVAPPKDLFLNGVRELVKVDKRWIPQQRGSSLYIRPTLIGTEGFLGVRPSSEYLFFVILSPVGSYYKEGNKPVGIFVEEHDVRAAQGGIGATKAGANYAASLRAALQAKEKGYAQVLWLDSNHEYVEEVGTMNVFFVIDNEVVTPQLSGSILEGGVRNCALQVIKSKGLKLTERKISISELVEAHKSGRLTEAFGTGTAAVISPIGDLMYRDYNLKMSYGPVATMLFDEITGIQYGDKPDQFGWIEKLEV